MHDAWKDTQRRFPFETIAICLLPDHLHCIWKLPGFDSNYSIRWKEIKYRFTVGFLKEIGPGGERNESRQNRQEAAIWQRRFWEHTIDGEEDFENHFDYIHYNAVKHGLVERAVDWKWSSFHRYVREEIYDANWAAGDEGRLKGFEND